MTLHDSVGKAVIYRTVKLLLVYVIVCVTCIVYVYSCVRMYLCSYVCRPASGWVECLIAIVCVARMVCSECSSLGSSGGDDAVRLSRIIRTTQSSGG